MLELRQIKKSYVIGDNVTEALKGISIKFRKSEFVAILGQSGCGKTTLLNVIGGLDKYDSGDLKINGRSTKEYKDADWDAYRNHSIGFVFQSYNLIPHQSVLQNVELALSLCGVSKSERRKRAKQALEQVGLKDHLNKKPLEMSGGQMQRVAIARALVNNPDIILADEPTGALDSETSIQVMDILKEVSKERLVIMVTHNPELAEKYATRTVKMLDGVIINDSAPMTEDETVSEERSDKIKLEKAKKAKRPSMSLATSFGLSLKNLFTKKGRTILTSFAGSIGIIGIALIYAVSQGMTSFINALQEDTLSSYPLTLEEQHINIGSLLESFISKAESDSHHDKDAVYQKAMFYNLVNSLSSMETTENDLASFKKYIEAERYNEDGNSGLREALNGIQYTYDLDMLVYTKSVDGTIIQSDSQQLLQELLIEYFGLDLSSMIEMRESFGMGSSSSMSMSPMGTSAVLWQEMLPGEHGALISPLLEKQYDKIKGDWPSDYNEIVLVVDDNNELDDMTLYALGLKPKEDIDAVAQAAVNKTPVELDSRKWSFEEILAMEFRIVIPSDCYTFDENTGLYVDLRDSQTGLKYLYDNGTVLKVSGIIRPKEDAVSKMLKGAIGYTSKLTEYIINNAEGSSAIKAQLNDPTTDIFSGLPFKENTGNLSDEEKIKVFNDYIKTLDTVKKAEAYIKIKCIPSAEIIESTLAQTLGSMTREDMENLMVSAFASQMSMPENEIREYISAMSDEDITEIFSRMITEQTKAAYAAEAASKLAGIETEELAAMLDKELPEYKDEQLVTYYDEVLVFSESSYESNLKKLGYVDLDEPSSINLYASSFENKDIIIQAIDDYNNNVSDLEKISYTDYIGLMMSSITTIINAITYVLIAFVAISLIVSSIMIGVITLISVQERTKEIGILRAIGASKKNVSSMFNAETVMIGFASGTIGVIVTYLLCIPINIVIHYFTEINNLNAELPVTAALIFIAISVLLTLIAGIIPSLSAAKKDPVVALRTE